MARKEPKSLFRRLTKLFRSGPVVKRKIRALDTGTAVADKTKSSGALLFQKSLSPTYATITSNAYNLTERLARYDDFQNMEYAPEIAAALDIYADETCAQDAKGKVLHIFSENEKIREILEDLFYGTLNVDFNLRSWVRNLLKYGDCALYNDVSPEHGVVNAFPIPINEIEREENYDRDDPFAVRFRWVTMGNRTLENWEVTHFRLLGNDMFLPYGSSIIEPARRIWRQLILIEDAMLVYRVVRAPERRVFYVDVGNLPPEDVPMYLEQQKKNIRSSQVVDNQTGRVDLRYNPMSIDEDYWLPVRGNDTGTKIDTLAGGQNAAAVEDVSYIQKKLFAALKIPRAYLGYDESLTSKASLAQEDVRFSRTISAVQKTIVAELNKLAIIHLYANGFSGDDLQNFSLKMSNPSSVAQQQKLELWRAKLEIGGTIPENMISKEFVQKEIWELSSDQIEEINEQLRKERKFAAALELIGTDDAGGGDVGGGDDLFGDTGGDDAGADAGGDDAGGDLPPEENAGEEPEEETEPGAELLTSSDDASDDEEFALKVSLTDHDGPPVKAKSQLDRALYNRSRQRTHGASKTHMPDLAKMASFDRKKDNDVHDGSWMKGFISNPFGESVNLHDVPKRRPRPLPLDIEIMLEKMSASEKYTSKRKRHGNVLVEAAEREGEDVQEEIDALSALEEARGLFLEPIDESLDDELVIIEENNAVFDGDEE